MWPFKPILPLARCMFTAAICLACSACTVKDAIEKIQPTDFITDSHRLRKPKYTPFDLAWVAPDIQRWQYDTLIVEAVRIDKVNLDNWIYSTSAFLPSKEAYQQKLIELADYIQKAIAERFADYDKKPVDITVKTAEPVVEVPTEIPFTEESTAPKSDAPIELINAPRRTLIMQISICEANFGDPLVYGGLLAVPVPAVANLSTTVKSPSLCLEARFVDKDSNRVVSELVDKRFPQVKIVDVNRLTVSSALHEMADSFAEDIVDSFYRKRNEKIGRRLPFSLIPW